MSGHALIGVLGFRNNVHIHVRVVETTDSLFTILPIFVRGTLTPNGGVHHFLVWNALEMREMFVLFVSR